MKEINDKTLSKIYSGYIGGKIKLSQHRFSEDQEDNVLTLDGVCSDGFYVKETGIKSGFCSNDSILVTSILDVTDEDAIYLSRSLNGLSQTEKVALRVGKEIIKQMSINWFADDYQFKDILHAFQYLQSKGYALPYLDYSVEDLVKLGVYTLK